MRCRYECVNLSIAKAIFFTGHERKISFKNHLNPVLLVFIGKLSVCTIRCVPFAWASVTCSAFPLPFLLTKFENLNPAPSCYSLERSC